MSCPDCGHWHDGRKCDVLKVGGPPVDNDREPLSMADQHTGRTLTRCGCTNQPGNGSDSTRAPSGQTAQPESH
jgi:hypothetical protein